MTESKDDKDVLTANRRITDQLEFASDLQDEWNRRGIELARDALREQQHPDFDGKHCLDCGDEVHPERLRLLPHCSRCTECQELKEGKRR